MTGQLCWGKTGSRVWTSLLSSSVFYLLTHLVLPLFVRIQKVQHHECLQGKTVWRWIRTIDASLPSLWQQAFPCICWIYTYATVCKQVVSVMLTAYFRCTQVEYQYVLGLSSAKSHNHSVLVWSSQLWYKQTFTHMATVASQKYSRGWPLLN